MNTLIDMKHIEYISKLNLTIKEKQKFKLQLRSILEFFSQIDEANVKDIETSFHPCKIKNVWRKDEIKNWVWNPLKHTKHKENRYFNSPRIA